MATQSDANQRLTTEITKAGLQTGTENLPSANAPALLKRKCLAVKLNCSLRMIDNLQSAGMPCVFIGRSRRFVFSEVLAWLKRKGGRA